MTTPVPTPADRKQAIELIARAEPLPESFLPLLFPAIAEERRLQSALIRVAELASTAQDLEQFYRSVHDIVAELMPARDLFIALYDRVADLVSFPYYVDEYDPLPEPRSLANGLTDFVLRSGRPVFLPEEQRGKIDDLKGIEAVGTDCIDWLGVPLKRGEETFGVLAVQSYTPNVRYSARDQKVLTYVSHQISSALEHKRAEARLYHDAFHDPLTGLPNRSLLRNRLEKLLARVQAVPLPRFALLFLDLDDFKAVNDEHGHLLGDRFLSAVARRLEECLRPGDMVARFAGDEFALLADGLDEPADAVRVAERVLEYLAPRFNLDDKSIQTSASVGIAMSDPEHRDPEAMLHHADEALYRAKRGGKGRYAV